MRRRLIVLGAAAAAAPGAARAGRIEALFAPRARLWDRWVRHDPQSLRRVDHGAWDGFLARNRRLGADGIARIAYGQVTAADRAVLAAYIDRVAAEPVSDLSRAEQFACWVNLYNALTVQVVLRAYPVRSIRDIDLGGSLIIGGPWDAPLVRVEGEAVTLNDIEHRILRPIWRDARIHYVVNCASIGCPNLPAVALSAEGAEAALAAGARDYVNHPRGAAPGPSGIVASSIYAWFERDFGGFDGVVPHLIAHAAPPAAEALRAARFIAGYRYDWTLNDATA